MGYPKLPGLTPDGRMYENRIWAQWRRSFLQEDILRPMRRLFWS